MTTREQYRQVIAQMDDAFYARFKDLFTKEDSVLKKIFMPFERAWLITIHFRNGRSYSYTALSWKCREKEDQLISWYVTSAVGAPAFWKASDVTMITTKRVWRRRA
jgi:hypothetical protein